MRNEKCLFATQASGVGTDVDEIVGRAHDFFVVFDDDNGIAYVAQLFQYLDKSVGIARVQADARLVEDVETAHE